MRLASASACLVLAAAARGAPPVLLPCNQPVSWQRLPPGAGSHVEVKRCRPAARCYAFVVTPPADAPNVPMTAYVAAGFDPDGIDVGTHRLYVDPNAITRTFTINGTGVRTVPIALLPPDQIQYLQITASVG